MSHAIRLVLVLHNHQPIGNFDGVVEQAYQESYRPFLDVFQRYPTLRIGLHVSGSLLEWLAANHPEYLDRLAELSASSRIEIIGGAFYEPILPMLPRRDRVGQITAYSHWLLSRLGTKVRGMWMPERVWEQSLVSDLAAAGIAYTVLDDFHFKNAGLIESQLHGYYVTEDDGHLLAVFPGSEKLRYTIPFAAPGETIDYLRRIADERPGAIVVFGDDGEKFGTWPETHRHVYENGWLKSFLDAIVANEQWIKVTTLGEAFDNVPPAGKIYLPDSSYREMTEWALPAEQLARYEHVRHELEHDPRWPAVAQFVRGGFWRNFKVKYPESDEMYTRMLMISNRLAAAQIASQRGDGKVDPSEVTVPHSPGFALQQVQNGNPEPAIAPYPPIAHPHVDTSAPHAELLASAQSELYRAQCNCGYWHGAFGGIYLPHLRNAVYRHLISADNLLDQAADRTEPWVEAAHSDFNLDAREEVYLGNDRLACLFSPYRGGMLYELDVRSICHNLLATLARRPEAYHRKVLGGATNSDSQVASIHDRVVFKQPGLDQRLQYDTYPRKSLVDHFYDNQTSIQSIASGTAQERGDFVLATYEARIRRNPNRIQVHMSRLGNAWGHPLKITKGVTLEAGSSSLEVAYLLEGLPPGKPFHFAVEYNFAGMPSGWDDRYFHDGHGRRLGQLGRQLDLSSASGLGLVDEYLGIDCTLRISQPSQIWTFPIETVSQSEAGFEAVHQSVAVLPHWIVEADANGRWSVTMNLNVDTSLAESRHEKHAATAAI